MTGPFLLGTDGTLIQSLQGVAGDQDFVFLRAGTRHSSVAAEVQSNDFILGFFVRSRARRARGISSGDKNGH
jgi:hypothetical protein